MTENTSVLIFSCRHMEINVQFQWTKGGWAWSFVAWTGTIWIVSILYSLDRNQGWCFIGVTIGSRLQVTWETLARYSRTVLVTLHPDRNTIEILNLAIWFVLELGHVSLVSTLYPVSCTHVQLQRAVLTTQTQTFNKIWLISYLFSRFPELWVGTVTSELATHSWESETSSIRHCHCIVLNIWWETSTQLMLSTRSVVCCLTSPLLIPSLPPRV